MRVHGVRRQADRVLDPTRAAAVVLGHHVGADHPPGLADVELVRPVAVVGELVPGQAPRLKMPADLLRHARMVGQRPHQPLLVIDVLLPDAGAGGIVALGVVVVHADVVGGEGEVVVRVGLAIGHEDRVPGQAVIAGLEVAQQQLVLLLVVAGRLGQGPAVLGPVGGAEAEVVRLHAAVALAVDARRAGVDARQQAAGRVARLDVRIDLLDELVVHGRF